MKTKAFFILTNLLFLMWTGLTAPIWYPCVMFIDYLDGHGMSSITWLFRVFLGVYFFWVVWFSLRMSYYMTILQMPFVPGMKEGFKDVRYSLSFIPIVGRWFEKKKVEDKKEDLD